MNGISIYKTDVYPNKLSVMAAASGMLMRAIQSMSDDEYRNGRSVRVVLHYRHPKGDIRSGVFEIGGYPRESSTRKSVEHEIERAVLRGVLS